MNANNSSIVSSQHSLPKAAEDNSLRNTQASQTTLDAEVVSAEVVGSIPASGVRQKLDAAKSHFEQAGAIVQHDAMPRVEQAIQLLVEIDNQRGWRELGYNSMRQMIQSELKPLLNLSVSQTYRRFNAARVRQEVSHLCDNIDQKKWDASLALLGRLLTFNILFQDFNRCAAYRTGKIRRTP